MLKYLKVENNGVFRRCKQRRKVEHMYLAFKKLKEGLKEGKVQLKSKEGKERLKSKKQSTNNPFGG